MRKRVNRSGWWILASAVGGVVGGALVWAMGWAAGGAVTGFALAKLLRHPIPKAQGPQQEKIVDWGGDGG